MKTDTSLKVGSMFVGKTVSQLSTAGVASVKGNYNFYFKVPRESGVSLMSLFELRSFFFPSLFYSFFNEHEMTIAVRSRLHRIPLASGL